MHQVSGDIGPREILVRNHFTEILDLIPQYPNCTEVMLNPNGMIVVEYEGGRIPTEHRVSPKKAHAMLLAMAGYAGVVLDSKTPAFGAKLPFPPYGRFQGIANPVTSNDCFAIRIPPERRFTMEDLIKAKTLTRAQAKLLQKALLEDKNVIVCGVTGSGKTTIASSMLEYIIEDRVLLAEDNPELVVPAIDQVAMLTNEHFTTRDAVFASLRMRPDKLLVGEVRDGATTIEMLQAWLTGHGGIATIHAKSADAVKGRLKNLMEQVVLKADMELIDEVVDIVVHVAKIKGTGKNKGKIYRKVVEIKEFHSGEKE
jgi:Flp pilus assembly CpaF family ATPase